MIEQSNPRLASPALPPLEFEPAPRATLGCVQLPTDLTLDEEGPALLMRVPDVRLRLQKLELDGESLDLENYGTARGRLQRAAAALRPTDSIDVLGLACTSLAFTLGIDEVHRELQVAHPSAKVTDMASALLNALDHTGSRRIALVTPYVPELHERSLALLRDSGREIVSERALGLETDAQISALSESCLHELVLAVDDPRAEAVVIACSAFRACRSGFLDRLEDEIGKPVFASQQCFLWHLLRLAGIDDTIGGYGSLFSSSLPEPEPIAVRPPAPTETEDVYPSRVPTPGWVERVDPVVSRETRGDGPLSHAEVERFERDGALVMRQVFTPDEVSVLRGTVRALREEYEGQSYDELDRGTDMRIITERGGSLVDDSGDHPTLKSIWQIHLPPEHAPHMKFAAELARRTVCDSRLIDVARQLIGEEVYIHQSRINFQRGITEHNRGGTGFLWHQDFEQWHCEDGMPRMRAVSMAVLLEPAIPANGALMVMPGSHRRMLQAKGDPTESGRYAVGALSRGPELPVGMLSELADEQGIQYCRGRAGDVVVFDCNVMHGSHTNISPWGRCMFFAVYNAVSNVPRATPFAAAQPRPEHIGSHDPRFAGVPLPSLRQSLV